MFSRSFFVAFAVTLVCVYALSASARRRRGDNDVSGGGEASEERIREVAPTYLDSLNEGRELRLTDDDFSSIARQQTDVPARTPSGRTEAADAYRVQCFASSSIEAVRAEKKVAEEKLDFPTYIVFVEPYYKLHVGDFKSRADADAALERIKKAGYSEAWIVRSSVHIDE